MQNRLHTLRVRHGLLDARIRHEQCRPAPNSLRITSLKKLKLRLREEISRIERHLDTRALRGSASA